MEDPSGFLSYVSCGSPEQMGLWDFARKLDVTVFLPSRETAESRDIALDRIHRMYGQALKGGKNLKSLILLVDGSDREPSRKFQQALEEGLGVLSVDGYVSVQTECRRWEEREDVKGPRLKNVSGDREASWVSYRRVDVRGYGSRGARKVEESSRWRVLKP